MKSSNGDDQTTLNDNRDTVKIYAAMLYNLFYYQCYRYDFTEHSI